MSCGLLPTASMPPPTTQLESRKYSKKIYVLVLWCILSLVCLFIQNPKSIYRMSATNVCWTNAGQCGLGGINCQPFDGEALPFYCPGGSGLSEITMPRYIGIQTINHRPLVIGGRLDDSNHSSAVYRGDSFVCGAAVHAGTISSRHGGCGVLKRRSGIRNYPSTMANGIESIGFDASFPVAISFEPFEGAFSYFLCRDNRWEFLFNSILLTAVSLRWIHNLPMAFASVFTIIFFHVALISDPPDEPAYSSFDNVISEAAGRFLPAAFVASVLYQCVVRPTITHRSSREKLGLWLSAAWIGALSNVVLRKVPLQRLTARDLKEQEGAILALACILLVIAAGTVTQVLTIRARGRLHHYLWLYSLLVDLLVILWLVPGQTLRIHHYILALLLLPGTAFPTPTSMVFQGFLLGLFINGVARWGFASILETQAAIFAGRPVAAPLPDISAPHLTNTTISFQWPELPVGWQGMQVLVNDVLRYQEIQSAQSPLEFHWTKEFEEPAYIRACHVGTDRFRGLHVGVCTPPGVWTTDGKWLYSA